MLSLRKVVLASFILAAISHLLISPTLASPKRNTVTKKTAIQSPKTTGTTIPKFVMLPAVTIADADPSNSEVNVVTSDDCFARIHISPNTVIQQNSSGFQFGQVKRGRKISCKGNWDAKDSSVFNAVYVFVGNMVSELDVMDRVKAACSGVARQGTSAKSTCTASRELREKFYAAATNDQLSEVKRLLAEDKTLLNARDENNGGGTPLMYATAWGNTDVMEFLLNSGADVNETDDAGGTALHLAALKHQEGAMRCLLEHKADVNAKTKSGQLALDLVLTNPSMCRLLRKYGAKSNHEWVFRLEGSPIQ